MIAKSNLLTIRGIHKSDYDKPVVTATVIAMASPDTSYPEPPARFTTAAEWQKLRTTLWCWECSLVPHSYPKFIPTDPCGDDSCKPYGNFCDWGCVVSYIMKNYSKAKAADVLQTLAYYESMFSGKYKQRLPCAESKTKMKQYCGPIGISEAEFREKNAALLRDNELSTYKMEHLDTRQIRAGK